MSVRAAAQALLEALDGDGFSLHDLRNAEEALRAALAADTVEVPRQATPAMITAFLNGYRAMIEAAQEAKG